MPDERLMQREAARVMQLIDGDGDGTFTREELPESPAAPLCGWRVEVRRLREEGLEDAQGLVT